MNKWLQSTSAALCIAFLLCACGQKADTAGQAASAQVGNASPVDTESPDASGPASPGSTIVATDSPTNTVEAQPSNPEFLDETQYAGDELEIVKLLNARIKYLFEENVDEYSKLLLPDSMHRPTEDGAPALPAYKIQRIALQSDISIREQKKIFEAVLSAEEYRMGDSGDPQFNTYVFHKGKEPGDRWGIFDID